MVFNKAWQTPMWRKANAVVNSSHHGLIYNTKIYSKAATKYADELLIWCNALNGSD